MLYVLVAIAVTLGLYFALGIRRFALMVLVPALIAATIYLSWYNFSGQYKKDQDTKKFAERFKNFVDETRRVENNARLGYTPPSGRHPTDTSPLGVLRFKYHQYDGWNDRDLLEAIHRQFYSSIPEDKFDTWFSRDPYGQEEIDAYVKAARKPEMKGDAERHR